MIAQQTQQLEYLLDHWEQDRVLQSLNLHEWAYLLLDLDAMVNDFDAEEDLSEEVAPKKLLADDPLVDVDRGLSVVNQHE